MYHPTIAYGLANDRQADYRREAARASLAHQARSTQDRPRPRAQLRAVLSSIRTVCRPAAPAPAEHATDSD